MDQFGTVKFTPPASVINDSVLSVWILTGQTAGSALDYLEEFVNSFIIISDNQSSYPAHSLMIENFCTTGLFM